MFCPACGSELSQDELSYRICFTCGNRLLNKQSIGETKPPVKNDQEKELQKTIKQ